MCNSHANITKNCAKSITNFEEKMLKSSAKQTYKFNTDIDYLGILYAIIIKLYVCQNLRQ